MNADIKFALFAIALMSLFVASLWSIVYLNMSGYINSEETALTFALITVFGLWFLLFGRIK